MEDYKKGGKFHNSDDQHSFSIHLLAHNTANERMSLLVFPLHFLSCKLQFRLPMLQAVFSLALSDVHSPLFVVY